MTDAQVALLAAAILKAANLVKSGMTTEDRAKELLKWLREQR